MYFFYLYHGKNMLHYTFAYEMMWCVSYVLDQNDDIVRQLVLSIKIVILV
jgi:hypothetical protein